MAANLLDLHGFKADEVMDAVDRYITAANKKGLDQGRIMTGKGTGKVKKVVIDYLKTAQYPWKYEKLPNGKDNEGILVIFLT